MSLGRLPLSGCRVVSSFYSVSSSTSRAYEIRALEVIGYDPSIQAFPSTVFSNVAGIPLPYRYDVQGNDVSIRTEFGGGATYTGSFSEDGNAFSGGWRPDEGKEGPGNVAYDLWGRRAQ
jgi:hypothetical protein